MRRKLDEYLTSRRSSRGEAKETAVREVDLEQFANMVAEKTVAKLVKGLLEEVEKLRERVEDLKKEIEDLKNEVRLLRASSRLPHAKRGFSRGEEDEAVLLEIKKRIKDHGFVTASELRSDLNLSPFSLRKLIPSLSDVEVIEAGGDLVIVSKSALREFKERMAKLKTSDPVEATRSLGKYSRLFASLRREGLIIYDPKEGWRLLEL